MALKLRHWRNRIFLRATTLRILWNIRWDVISPLFAVVNRSCFEIVTKLVPQGVQNLKLLLFRFERQMAHNYWKVIYPFFVVSCLHWGVYFHFKYFQMSSLQPEQWNSMLQFKSRLKCRMKKVQTLELLTLISSETLSRNATK